MPPPSPGSRNKASKKLTGSSSKRSLRNVVDLKGLYGIISQHLCGHTEKFYINRHRGTSGQDPAGQRHNTGPISETHRAVNR
jgi:hypothetical protein